MKTGSHLLAQLERCGLSAELAEQHREVSDDTSGARVTRQEIVRAWATRDQAQTEDAHSALMWLSSCGGVVKSVGEELDLVDAGGVVLVTGRPGAVLEMPDGEVLVVSWVIGDHFDYPEPEDDLGLVAMGLAASEGVPFRTGHVYLKGGEAICRRSHVFPNEARSGLCDRIRAAVNRPREACAGDWCGACRQRIYCDAWLYRARAAVVVLEGRLNDGEAFPELEITNENAGALADRISTVEKVIELAKEQLKAAVRQGVRCVRDGKEYVCGSCEGRETADVKALKAAGLTDYVKKGQPFETWRWKKIEAIGGRR